MKGYLLSSEVPVSELGLLRLVGKTGELSGLGFGAWGWFRVSGLEHRGSFDNSSATGDKHPLDKGSLGSLTSRTRPEGYLYRGSYPPLVYTHVGGQLCLGLA